jgi:mRNA-degrading endonuclease RelE of RelBE toxin-antitoxin system
MGATLADAERVIANPDEIDVEANGKRHYIGLIRGQRVRVVVAFDDPELIVTIHRRRR